MLNIGMIQSTWETLPSFRNGVWPTSNNKARKPNDNGKESDHCIVLRKRGNARRGKAVTYYRPCWGHLLRCKRWIQENRHLPKDTLMGTLSRKLLGYYRYYGITHNREMVKNFLDEVKRHLFKNLNRRSQRRSYTWDKFVLFLKRYPLPKPKMYVNIFELRRHISYIL